MERKFDFLGWILLMKILQPIECSNIDPLTVSTFNTSNVNANTDNGRLYYILRNGSSSTITIERLSSSKGSKLPPTESPILNIPKFVSKYSKNEKESREELMKNSIQESWYRVKRDNEDVEYTKLDDSNDSDQETITGDSFQNDDGTANQEEIEDSNQVDHAEWDTQNVQDGEEEDTRSWKKGLVESRSRNGIEDGHWFNFQRKPHHNFIRIPIFSGK